MTKRNEKCPCGSGKKYKICCLQNDLKMQNEKAVTDSIKPEQYEENPDIKFPTWKIFLIGTAILGVIGLLLAFVFDLPRAGGATFGCGMIILIMFTAFRNVPTVRKRPGDGANLDFGNR